MRTKPGIRSASNSDGMVLLDVEQNQILTLNPMGALIWQKLQEEKSLESIAEELSSTTGHPLADVKNDLDVFVQDLNDKHLVIQ